MPSALRIEALGARDGGYLLHLQLSGGERELRDADCRALFEGAVVIVAAAFNQAAASSAVRPPPPVTPIPEPPPPAPAPAPVAPAVAAPLQPSSPSPAAARPGVAPKKTTTAASPQARKGPRPRPRPASPPTSPGGASAPSVASLAAGVGVSGGVLPGLGAILELGAQLEPAPWGFALAARYWPERNATRAGRGVELNGLGARAAALVRVAPAVFFSIGLEVNRLSGTGSQSVSSRDSDAAWQLAPSLGLSAIVWEVGDLRLELGASGRLSVFRPQFLVTGFGELYRVPELGADAILRGAWLFR